MGVYFIEMDAVDASPPAQTTGNPVDLDVEYSDAYGAGGGYNARTLNKVWQPTHTQWVYWRTDDPDPAGASFPGPGVYGTTTNYTIVSVFYISV